MIGTESTAAGLLDTVLRGDGGAEAFALLHRPGAGQGDAVDVLTGPVYRPESLDCLAPHDGAGHQLLAVVPYRQIQERGYTCRDDGEPTLALRVQRHGRLPVADMIGALPERPVPLHGLEMEVDDESYGEIVRRVVNEEIARGEGANFVIHRCLTGSLGGIPARDAALAVFRRLLAHESGAHWTFLVHTPGRTFVGASPERHVGLSGGQLSMNPISGTLRYPPEGPDLPGTLAFLADRKEADELYMVVDEELKMMAQLCSEDIRLDGPYLRGMARLAHTEYMLRGRTAAAVPEILRHTLFAPTVVGSPLENATRVIARHEQQGRGYYSGVLALIGRSDDGAHELDSAILIRSADLRGDRVRIGVGATLVRLSDPAAEAAETRAKAAGLLAAFAGTSPERPATTLPRLPQDGLIAAALRRRNQHLSRFWLTGPEPEPAPAGPAGNGRHLHIVDAEDRFTAMLAYQLRASGLTVTVGRWGTPVDPAADLVLVGPGPGDPTDLADAKIAELRRLTAGLLAGRSPFLAVCLGHQVLAGLCGLEVRRRPAPQQGVQRTIDLFGRRRTVGFYNSFAAYAGRHELVESVVGDRFRVSRDAGTGEVHGLRGHGFASVQFHPESVLTLDGPALVLQMVDQVLADTAAVPAAGAEAVVGRAVG